MVLACKGSRTTREVAAEDAAEDAEWRAAREKRVARSARIHKDVEGFDRAFEQKRKRGRGSGAKDDPGKKRGKYIEVCLRSSLR